MSLKKTHKRTKLNDAQKQTNHNLATPPKIAYYIIICYVQNYTFKQPESMVVQNGDADLTFSTRH